MCRRPRQGPFEVVRGAGLRRRGSWELPDGAELDGEEHGGDGRQVLVGTTDGKAIAMSVRGEDSPSN